MLTHVNALRSGQDHEYDKDDDGNDNYPKIITSAMQAVFEHVPPGPLQAFFQRVIDMHTLLRRCSSPQQFADFLVSQHDLVGMKRQAAVLSQVDLEGNLHGDGDGNGNELTIKQRVLEAYVTSELLFVQALVDDPCEDDSKVDDAIETNFRELVEQRWLLTPFVISTALLCSLQIRHCFAANKKSLAGSWKELSCDSTLQILMFIIFEVVMKTL